MVQKSEGKSVEWCAVSNESLQGRARAKPPRAEHAEEAVGNGLRIQQLLPGGLE